MHMNQIIKEFNVYCDESCHLQNDNEKIMLLGAVWCPKDKIKKISSDIRKLKEKYNAKGELKWTKVSKSKIDFYQKLVSCFFHEKDLHFRCLVVDDKSKLEHDFFNSGSHDAFYYKMYFSLLKIILDPIYKYRIYVDIKDTKSQVMVNGLKDVLCNNVHDFTREMIEHIQQIRSHESEIMQMSDFLIGAVGYKNRKLNSNEAKTKIVNIIENKRKYSLDKTSSLFNTKFNVFIFSPRLKGNLE